MSADQETFTFLMYEWDVTAAAREAEGLPVVSFTVRSAFQLLPFVYVDQGHAKTVDLTKPLLAVQVKEVGSALVIDGWHRLWRAAQEGVETLPCKLLTEHQEARVRLRDGRGWAADRAARRRLLRERHLRP